MGATISTGDPVDFVVVYNGAMEVAYAARRREALRALEAEANAAVRAIEDRAPLVELDEDLAEEARLLELPESEAVRTAPPAAATLAGSFVDEAFIDQVCRVIRRAYPAALSNVDVAAALDGTRRVGRARLEQFSRARLTLERSGRVVRCGFIRTPDSQGRPGLVFRWVPDTERAAPPPPALTRDRGPRAFASVLVRVRAHLAAIYPQGATHAELLRAIAPEAADDDLSLLRTISKARQALELQGDVVRQRHASGQTGILIRLSAAAKAALDGRSACSA